MHVSVKRDNIYEKWYSTTLSTSYPDDKKEIMQPYWANDRLQVLKRNKYACWLELREVSSVGTCE